MITVIQINGIDNKYQENEQVSPIRYMTEGLFQYMHCGGMKWMVKIWEKAGKYFTNLITSTHLPSFAMRKSIPTGKALMSMTVLISIMFFSGVQGRTG
jgi:hypothetical protein